ncbi:MAG: hypothetical protein PHH30_11810 [Bacteroidales bacterium]|nr:hypothetical protein [Bacteroidales bacterium]
MKKKLIAILLFSATFIYSSGILAQNVGIGTTTPHASAMLDVQSSSQGILIPRVTLIATNNSTTPVNGPATGLLVYNSGGSLENGFYYWDGTEWVLVGSGGGSTGCSTLDEAYDCNGSGSGRQITADAGAVEITLPLTGTNTSALYVVSNKGAYSSPTAAIDAFNSQYGAGLSAELTNTSNPYSAVIGVSNSSLTTGDLSCGVSGYHDGIGMGVGVWGQTSTNSTAGASYAVYGVSSGNGNGFGGYFYSNKYPGIYGKTNASTSQAAQFAAAGENPLNPAMLSVGSSQFYVSNNAGCQNIIMNNLGSEPTIAPQANEYGMLGTASYAWYYTYTYNIVTASRRNIKRDITYINEDEDLSQFVMQDIEKMKPAFYKFNIETDEYDPENPSKYRPNMHLGVIIDEAPDYIQDNTFSGIDIYALSTLCLAGVQENNKAIKELQCQINDFGVTQINGKTIYVKYNKDFSGTQPVVTVTPNSYTEGYFISSQDDKGFTIELKNPGNFSFNWIAMAEKNIDSFSKENINIDPQMLSQLKVDEATKEKVKQLLLKEQTPLMELKPASDNEAVIKRYR